MKTEREKKKRGWGGGEDNKAYGGNIVPPHSARSASVRLVGSFSRFLLLLRVVCP